MKIVPKKMWEVLLVKVKDREGKSLREREEQERKRLEELTSRLEEEKANDGMEKKKKQEQRDLIDLMKQAIEEERKEAAIKHQNTKDKWTQTGDEEVL